jgi:hypothetical protein
VAWAVTNPFASSKKIQARPGEIPASFFHWEVRASRSVLECASPLALWVVRKAVEGHRNPRLLARSLKETSRFPASFLFRRKLNKTDVDFNFI